MINYIHLKIKILLSTVNKNVRAVKEAALILIQLKLRLVIKMEENITCNLQKTATFRVKNRQFKQI